MTGVGLLGLFVLGCQQPSSQSAVLSPVSTEPQQLPSTGNLRAHDTLEDFRQIAIDSADPPMIEELHVPNSVTGIPDSVVHIVFNEGVFFDFDKDYPRPEAAVVLDRLAKAISDSSSAGAVTVLGHTDAIGTDGYNLDLSRRRAANVMVGLIRREIDPAQLSTVAVGKRQPIAPNDTPDGRARNRRVEFLISSNLAANLAVLRGRKIEPTFFGRAGAASNDLQIFTIQPDVQTLDKVEAATLLIPAGVLHLEPVRTVVVPVRTVVPVRPAPPPDAVQLPSVQLAPLLPKPVPYSQ